MNEISEFFGSGLAMALFAAGGVALLAVLLRARWRKAVGFLAVTALVVTPMVATAQDATPQVTETNPTFRLIPSDLEFILDQIQISEAHAYAQASGDTNYTLLCDDPADTSGKCVPDPTLPYGLRTVDGSFNNLINEEIGASNRVMPRLLPIEWRDADDPPPPPAPQNPPGVSADCAEAGSTCYEQTNPEAIVYDSDPRVISNLVVDNTTSNPAAVDAAADNPGAVVLPNDDIYLPNIMADEGLSAPVNLWFVFFGQFFDHGLDLVNKGGSGTIIVPLNPDDPLYVPGAPTNFMMLDRATNQPGPDGQLGTSDDVREHENRTTPWVDQNQTYTSHPAHQVFLREYELVDGVPRDTGRLLNGADQDGDGQGDGLATWNDVKAQAANVLGIELTDQDVLAVPQVLVDYYGNFIPDANGMPQLITDAGAISGDPSNPIDTSTAIDLNQAFLDDIAHGANPGELAGYDNVLLGEHFITGDGRGNENIGLTAVHHVFHSEHNRMAAAIEETLNAPGNEDLLAAFQDQSENDDWTYEQRLFQAARFPTEMQYQHLVFEEFARTVQPAIDVVTFNENSYDTTIDASIRAEFAHVVYRFGHSMLTEDILREGFGAESASLLDGFLNPVAFLCRVQPTAQNECPDPATNGLTSDEAAGAIVNGTTNQAANQIDELVTSTLRNSLLGLPLDLAAINLMRGRDVGVPPLQVARREFFAASNGNSQLEPYSSWEDYGFSLRNGNNFGRGDSQASLINFIAAYGTHPTITAQTTLVGKRAAAEAIVNGTATTDLVERISGPDRYATAAAVSRSTFPGTAPVVYVANGLNFPDALAGGPGASVDGAPLLLVGDNSIPIETALELNRLQPGEVVILGGTGVVSTQVEASLDDSFATVTRVSGPDRFATAAAVSQRAYPAGATTAYVANGMNFPDALSGGAAAAATGAPLLLVRPTGAIPAATAAELTRLGVTDIKVLGGTGAVSAATAAALATFGTVERLSGPDRYDTSVAISQDAFPSTSGGTVYLATGTNFPDALSAAPAGSPLLLVPGQSTTLPANVGAEILRLNPARIVILGGTGAVNDVIADAVSALFPAPEAPADRGDFLRSTGTWANVDGETVTGLEEVDFWVGGLAEAVEPFGGLLGSTFNYVFEAQLEDLQFGDRFYYLFRNQGNQLFAALEANSFSSLIQRNSEGSLLPASIFSVHEPFFDLENLPDPLPAGLVLTADGTYRWDGDEHIEMHGNRTEADRMEGGQGDDALWGYGGNDRIEGGSGNDSIVAGDGDDIVTDSFGDDNIKGGDGNDAIDAGAGIDLVLAGAGDDFINKPQDNSDGALGFFGTGDDIFLGGTGRDNPIANEGDDWLEGGPHADLLIGDNSQQFQNDVNGGDDVLNGGPGSDDMDAEGGDDVTVGGLGGSDRHHGMYGFDHVTFYGTTAGIDADMNFNLQPPDVTAIRDRYIQTETLSGGSGNDILRGLGFVPADATGAEVNWLTEEGLDLVTGLRELLQPDGTTGGPSDFTERFRIPDTTGNLLMGGSGSDLIEGRAGDDFIDGDAHLRVQLVHVPTQERADSAAAFRARIFNGTMNPGEFDIVREIVIDDGADAAIDTAVYLSAQGDATVTDLGGGYYSVDAGDEGIDILRNIEEVEFSDGCVVLATMDPCAAVPAALNVTASGGEIAATLDLGDGAGVTTQSAPAELQMTVQALNEDGSWVPVTGSEVDSEALEQTLTVPEGTEGDLRVVTTYVDGDGVLQEAASEVLPGN